MPGSNAQRAMLCHALFVPSVAMAPSAVIRNPPHTTWIARTAAVSSRFPGSPLFLRADEG
jgi:hypothetical protein